MLKRLVASHFVRIFMFSAMLITAGNEVVSNFSEIGAHHGVTLFAFFQLLKALAAFFEAADILDET
jgi:hypothetical protein